MDKIKFYNVDRFYKNNKNKILEITNQEFSNGQVLEGEAVLNVEKKLATLTKTSSAFSSPAKLLHGIIISWGFNSKIWLSSVNSFPKKSFS